MAKLYEGIKNRMVQASLEKNLRAVVAATTDTAKAGAQPPTNYVVLDIDKAKKLSEADPSLVVLAPSADGKTQAVQATAAGIAAVNAADPVEPKQRIALTGSSFVLDAAPVELPAIRRGGDRTSLFPFDNLAIHPAPGSSFFVPATEAMPDPAKTMASTVSSATRRYRTAQPARVFTIRGNEDEFPGQTVTGRKGARVWRIEPAQATPAQADGSNATAAQPAA